MEDNYTCVLCGAETDEELGLEVGDGWICEDCAACLSPWVSEEDLEFADTEDLEEQVSLREENQEKLEDFCPTRSFYLPGMTEKVYLDDETKTFIVTEDNNIRLENPDLITLEQVMDASVEVEDDREEIGDHLYLYSYNLSLHIELDHPYLSDILFPLHAEPLTFESSEKSFLGFGGFDPEEMPAYQSLASFGQDLADALTDCEEEINHRYDVRPGEFNLGQELSYEEEEDQELPEEEPASDGPAEGDVITCPWCGCRTHVGKNFRCESCGGSL